MKTLARTLFCLLLLTLFAGCSKPLPFKGMAISSADIQGEDFTMINQKGQPTSLSQFKGQVVVLFFGYTHCPDVCPTTLIEIKRLMKALGERAAEVQPVFVSLDPERDTPQSLGPYLAAFDPRIVGLTGPAEALERARKAYRIVAVKQGSGSDYTLDHSANLILLDRQGTPRVSVGFGSDPVILEHDVRLLLNEKRD